MKGTRNSKFKLVAFNCYLDMVGGGEGEAQPGAWLSNGLCKHLTEVNISPKFNENLLKGSGDTERTQKFYGWTDRQNDRLTD